MDDRMDEDVEVEEDISNSDVITKYKTAADIANKVLEQVIKECVPEKKIVDICILGDKMIDDLVGSVYKTGKMEKGPAFPTSISVNHIVGHFSPLAEDTTLLKDGDLVKVDLGVHIDGFISVVAHSWIVAANPSVPTTGRQADVICAAHYAAEIAHRLVKPGKKNTDVTEAINKVAEQFKCNVVEGVLSHQMKRFVIDGNKVIISKSSLEHKVEEFEFEENSVYAIDIVMSTGEGKAKETELRTTIYKRAVDQNYLLKMKAARYVFNEINSRFPTLPFTLRALDEKRGRLGITECLKHDLVNPYPVLFEKQGEYVAQFKFTVLVLPSGTMKLNQHQLPYIQSNYKIEDPALSALLQTGTKRAKKNKKKSGSKKKTEKKPEGAETTTAQPMDTN
jgi:curved DNA binding protein